MRPDVNVVVPSCVHQVKVFKRPGTPCVHVEKRANVDLYVHASRDAFL
jgi:hypothetical protein